MYKTYLLSTKRSDFYALCSCKGDICINSDLNPLPKFSNSSRRTKFKDILPWKISQMVAKTIPFSTRIAVRCHKLCDEKEHPFLFWRKINGNWDVNMIRIAQSRESQEQILGSEEINPREQKFKCRSLESK